MVNLKYAQDGTIDDFREAVVKACKEDPCEEDPCEENPSSPSTAGCARGPFLVVSYNRQVVKQTGTGHFSPIAAYDVESDKVLVLDTARFKYGPHWVDLSLMFEAMQPVDPCTGKSRGFVLLSFEPDTCSPLMPISMLMRTKQPHNPFRRKYKEFLSQRKDDVTWDDVVEFWTQGGSNPEFVWTVMEPQLSTVVPEFEAQVALLRKLVRELIPSRLSAINCQVNCSDNGRMCLSPDEAIFIIYLASISEETRERVVAPQVSNLNLAQRQLLCEATLVRYAIYNSSDIMD